jgi:DNA-binding MarR family transcriptional regulator
MIPKDLLTANGTIEAFIELLDYDNRTTEELTEALDISESTVRRRMDDLHTAGLVELDAALRDEAAVRVYTLTPVGEEVCHQILSILDGESIPDPPDVRSATQPDTEPDTQQATEADTQADPPAAAVENSTREDDIKPSGVSFGTDQ